VVSLQAREGLLSHCDVIQWGVAKTIEHIAARTCPSLYNGQVKENQIGCCRRIREVNLEVPPTSVSGEGTRERMN